MDSYLPRRINQSESDKLLSCGKIYFAFGQHDDVMWLPSITGCRRTPGKEPQPTECNACRFFKLPVTGECVKECPGHQKPGDGGVICGKEEKYFNRQSITYRTHPWCTVGCFAVYAGYGIDDMLTLTQPGHYLWVL